MLSTSINVILNKKKKPMIKPNVNDVNETNERNKNSTNPNA